MKFSFSRQDLQEILLIGLESKFGLQIDTPLFGVTNITEKTVPYGPRPQQPTFVYVLELATEPYARYEVMMDNDGWVIVDNDAVSGVGVKIVDGTYGTKEAAEAAMKDIFWKGPDHE